MHLCYVGKYLSDIVFSKELFQYAIVHYKPLYTLPEVKVYSADSESFPAYISRILKKICNKDMLIFFRSPQLIPLLSVDEEIKRQIICSNQFEYTWLESKIASRLWVSRFTKTTPVNILTKSECSMPLLKSRFADTDSFVIQEEYASGGLGTFLLDTNNGTKISSSLSDQKCYIVSPYYPKLRSGNAHLFISDGQIVITPATQQLIKLQGSKLLYSGCEYNIHEQYANVRYNLLNLGRELQATGYRGYCGIDYLYSENEFIFVEINNRLQGSTSLMDMILQYNYGISIYTLAIKTLFNELDSLNQVINKTMERAYYNCTQPTEKNTCNLQYFEANTIRSWSFQGEE